MLTLVEGGAMGAGLQLPRSQVGSQPQHLLVTLLGDYFLDAAEFVPSAGLVGLLEEFGVPGGGARAALGRLARRGLLASSKSGRHTAYRLTPGAAAVLRESARRTLEFGASGRRWSGRWTIVAFSVPEARREVRSALRARLRWLGFAPLFDGLWVSPHSPTDALDEALSELAVDAASVFVGEAREERGSPLSAWDLDELRGVYDDFIAEFADVRRRTMSGEVGAAEGLVARARAMDRWRAIPGLDPDLPVDLLPEDWPRQAARALFVDVYEGLEALATLRVRQVMAEHTTLDSRRMLRAVTSS